MKVVAVLALLAVAIAAVAAAPQRGQSKIEQGKKIQLKSKTELVLKHKLSHHVSSTLDLDPIALDDAVLWAYIEIQETIDEFLLEIINFVLDNEDAYYELADVHYAFMEGTTYYYYDFSDAIRAGPDQSTIRDLVNAAIAFGNESTATAVSQVDVIAAQYAPGDVAQIKELGQQATKTVAAALQQVANLLE